MYVKKCLKAYQPKYYQENKERVQKNLAKDVTIYLKIKKQQYDREHYKNLSEDEKQKFVEYRKKYYRMWKNALL